MASRITNSGTPFSLATASTTRRSSLLMVGSLCFLRPAPQVRGNSVLWKSMGGLRSLPALAGFFLDQTERNPIRHQPGLFDVLDGRSEEHTSELSHLVISYAVFCLKKTTS